MLIRRKKLLKKKLVLSLFYVGSGSVNLDEPPETTHIPLLLHCDFQDTLESIRIAGMDMEDSDANIPVEAWINQLISEYGETWTIRKVNIQEPPLPTLSQMEALEEPQEGMYNNKRRGANADMTYKTSSQWDIQPTELSSLHLRYEVVNISDENINLNQQTTVSENPIQEIES